MPLLGWKGIEIRSALQALAMLQEHAERLLEGVDNGNLPVIGSQRGAYIPEKLRKDPRMGQVLSPPFCHNIITGFAGCLLPVPGPLHVYMGRIGVGDAEPGDRAHQVGQLPVRSSDDDEPARTQISLRLLEKNGRLHQVFDYIE